MGFVDRMKEVMSQGFDSTKEILGTAAEKAKELGEKGVLKFEISRLEKEAERKFGILGSHVYQMFVKKGQNSLSRGASEIKVLLTEIADLEKRVIDKEEALKKI